MSPLWGRVPEVEKPGLKTSLCGLFVIIASLFNLREDCQARKLNKEDAMDRCKWRKMIKEAQ